MELSPAKLGCVPEIIEIITEIITLPTFASRKDRILSLAPIQRLPSSLRNLDSDLFKVSGFLV